MKVNWNNKLLEIIKSLAEKSELDKYLWNNPEVIGESLEVGEISGLGAGDVTYREQLSNSHSF